MFFHFNQSFRLILVEKQNPRKGTETVISFLWYFIASLRVEKQNPRKGTETRT